MTYYLLYILYLHYGNDVRQKANQQFSFEFKMGVKQPRQLTTSTTHLAQEPLVNVHSAVEAEVLQRR